MVIRSYFLMSSPAERLSVETRELTGLFVKRLEGLRNLGGASSVARTLTRADSSLLRGGWAVGVDGSMDYDEHMELLLFYVAAAAYTCPFRVGGNSGGVVFDFGGVRRDDSLGFSTAVPLWSDDLGVVSPEGLGGYAGQAELSGVQRLPFALMTMAELSLGLRAVGRESTGILFLDRPLSGTYLPLARDLRLLLRSGSSVLVGQPTPRGELGWLDLALASVLGPPGSYVPVRRPYTVYAAIGLLVEEAGMGGGGGGVGLAPAELGRRLGLDDVGLERLLKALSKLNDRFGGALLEEFSPAVISVSPRVLGYWDRVVFVAEAVVGRVFGGGVSHPLHYGGERWLSVLDINALNSFLLLELVSRALRGGVLVLGVTKDTSATDYVRAVLPFLYAGGVVGVEPGRVGFKSDTAFLTVLSAANHSRVRTPWRTHAYDSCFASLTMGEGLRAARGRVSRERLFVKGYFQLRSFRGDPSMRSPVFGYERPFDPQYDGVHTRLVEAEERGGRLTLSVFVEFGGRSAVDDLALCVLAAGDNPEVFEAYGHNQLLYLADKAVKAEVRLMRHALRGIAYHELSGFERRERIFMVSRRFRELRAEAEAERERSLSGGERGSASSVGGGVL